MVKKKEVEEEKLIRKELLHNKKRAYSVDVKEKYKPIIDPIKQMESQRKFSTIKTSRKAKGPIRVNLNSS